MNFLIKTTALSLVAGAMTLATPNKSEAQVGVNLQFGNSGFSYYNGPSFYPTPRPYYGNYGNYGYGHQHNHYHGPRYGTWGSNYYGGPYVAPRPVVVVPAYPSYRYYR